MHVKNIEFPYVKKAEQTWINSETETKIKMKYIENNSSIWIWLNGNA